MPRLLKKAADSAERARPVTPRRDESDEDEVILVPGTALIAGESQGGTTITLALSTPEASADPWIWSPKWYLSPILPREGLRMGPGRGVVSPISGTLLASMSCEVYN